MTRNSIEGGCGVVVVLIAIFALYCAAYAIWWVRTEVYGQ